MNGSAVCDEGRVSFISSYRNMVDYRVRDRRFSVGHEFANGVHRYWCKDEADALALSAYREADRAEFMAWAERKGFDMIPEPSSVRVDRGMWHVLVYGVPE